MKRVILFFIIFFSFIIAGCVQQDKYSIEQYNSIYPGTTYQTCQSILDSPGVLMSETKIPGIPGYSIGSSIQTYSWQNDNGSNMVLMFEDGILTSKAQLGLQKQGHYSLGVSPQSFFLSSILTALFLAFIPAYIAKRKGRNFKRWYIYGFLLWIVAFIHSLLLSDHSGLQCPACKSWIKENSSVCKYCHVVLADYYREHPEIPPDKYDKEDTLL